MDTNTTILQPPQLLPVTSDIVFKQIFGQEESKPILMEFLNVFLHLELRSPEQIELKNTEITPEYYQDKKSILDIRVRLSDGTAIDLEIQVINQYNIEKRSLYYVAQLCVDQLGESEDYSKIRPSVGLNLLCFDLYTDKRYYRSFTLKDRETNEQFPDLFEINFLEIRKAIRTITERGSLSDLSQLNLSKEECWVLFIGSEDKEVLQQLTKQDNTIQKAYDRLVTCSSDEATIERYRARQKALRDWTSSINGAREEGRNLGFSEGSLKTIISQCCRKLARGQSAEEISEALESDPSEIALIVEAARQFAPDYDVDQIYALVHDSLSSQSQG